jgi:hypothetical protein
MLRDNLAGLIEPMVDRAGAHPLGGHHKAGPNGECSRSTELAIVALKRSWRQIFAWKTEQPTEKAKWPGFAVTTAAHDSRAVGTAWHQSHWTIDPQCLKKSPPRRGGIYALTKNVALHFTLNQDIPVVADLFLLRLSFCPSAAAAARTRPPDVAKSRAPCLAIGLEACLRTYRTAILLV